MLNTLQLNKSYGINKTKNYIPSKQNEILNQEALLLKYHAILCNNFASMCKISEKKQTDKDNNDDDDDLIKSADLYKSC